MAGLLAVAFLFTNVLAAYASETNFWSERRGMAQRLRASDAEGSLRNNAASPETSEPFQLLAQRPSATTIPPVFPQSVSIRTDIGNPASQSTAFSLPLGKEAPAWLKTLLPYGSVSDIYLSKKTDAPFIVYIQDAHGLWDAQQNISSMIQGLAETRGVALVGMEGAEGAFTTERYRRYPRPDITRGLAESFLKEGLLGGPEFAAIVAATPVTLWGVEALDLYQGNVQAFKDSLKSKTALQQFLTQGKNALEDWQDRVFSPELKEFNRQAMAYQSQKVGIGAYVRFLSQKTEGISPIGKKFPQCQSLLDALNREQSIDFKAVEKDRRQLAELLANRLSQKELKALAEFSLACRLGQNTMGDYNRYLQSLCQRHQLSLLPFKSFSEYMAYVSLVEQIKPSILMTELQDVEKALGERLAKTADQKQVMAIGRALSAVEKLANQSFTPEEWAAYQKERAPILAMVKTLSPTFDIKLLEPSEQFCRLATERNDAMVYRLLAKMKGTRSREAVLVAGGFHSDGLSQLLRGKDVSFAVVTPKITEVPVDHQYLDIFANDPLPLETLFLGEKISLVAPPATAVSSDHVRSRIVPGSWVVMHPALQDLLSTGEESHTREGLLEQAKINAQEIFNIRFLEWDIDRLSREGIFTLFNAKMVHEGTEVSCRVVALMKEQWNSTEQFLIEQGSQHQVVQQTEVNVDGKTVILVLMRAGESKTNPAAATFFFLDKLIRYFVPDATTDNIILTYAPFLESGIFGALYLSLTFVGAPAVIGALPEGLQWLSVLSVTYVITNVLFVLFHTSVYRFQPLPEDPNQGEWVLESVPWNSWSGWRTRRQLLLGAMGRVHWPFLLGSITAIPVLFGCSLVLASAGSLALLTILSFLMAGRIHRDYNLKAKNKGEPPLAYVLTGASRTKARKELDRNLGAMKRGEPLNLVFTNGTVFQGDFYGAHGAEDGQWIAVRQKHEQNEKPLQFFDLALIETIELSDKKTLHPAMGGTPIADAKKTTDPFAKVRKIIQSPLKLTSKRAVSLVAAIPAWAPGREGGSDLFEELVRLPSPELTLALQEAVTQADVFDSRWTFLLAILEERIPRPLLSREGAPTTGPPLSNNGDRLIQLLTSNADNQWTPQSVWSARYLINIGQGEILANALIEQLRAQSPESASQKSTEESRTFFAEILLETLEHLQQNSPTWKNVLALVPHFPFKQTSRLVDLLLTGAVGSLPRTQEMLEWSEGVILSEQFNYFSNLLTAFFKGAAENSVSAAALSVQSPRIINVLTALLSSAGYFELESTLKLMKTLLDASPQVEKTGGPSPREALLPQMASIMETEAASPQLNGNQFLSLLELAHGSGVDPVICENHFLRRVASSDAFVDSINANLKSGLNELGGIGPFSMNDLESVLERGLSSADSMLGLPEAKKRFSRVLANIRSHKDLASLLSDFQQSVDPSTRVILARALESHFETAIDLLSTVYREQRSHLDQLTRFVPSLHQMGSKGFSHSLFVENGALESLATNMASLTGILEDGLTTGWDTLDKIKMVVPFPTEDQGEIVSGYYLPFPLEDISGKEGLGSPTDKKRWAKYAVVSPEALMNPESKERLRAVFRARGRLLDANGEVLRLMAQLSLSPFRRQDAETVMILVEKMFESFSELQSLGALQVRPVQLDRIKRKVEEGLRELAPDDPISSDLRTLILVSNKIPERWEHVDNVNAAINFMHQEGLRLFRKVGSDAQSNVSVKVGDVQLDVTNLNDHPLVQGGHFSSQPLQTIVQSLQKPGIGPTAQIVVMDSTLEASIPLYAHSVEFSVDISPPERGGELRIYYSEWRKHEGNRMRISFLEKVFNGLGIHTEVINDMFLSAILDKDHNAVDHQQIEKALFFATRVLYYSIHLNLLFDFIIRGMTLKGSGDPLAAAWIEIEKLADVMLAEGSLPFYANIEEAGNMDLLTVLNSYLKDDPLREGLRSALNRSLMTAGLPLIPEGIRMGQLIIDTYYTQPLVAAIARGEVHLEGHVPVRNLHYTPVDDLAQIVLKDPGQTAQMASCLRSLGESLPMNHPIGAVGQLLAGESHWKLERGGWIVFRTLSDPESGRMAYATATHWDEQGHRIDLSPQGVRDLLREEGLFLVIGKTPTGPIRALSEKRLRASPKVNTMPGRIIQGIGVSPGPIEAGPVTFNRDFYIDPASPKAPILIVPATTPDDLPAMKASSGLIQTSGGMASHAGITMRELHLAAVILPGARWVHVNGRPQLVVHIQQPGKPEINGQGLWITSDMAMEERSIQEGDLVMVDGDRGVVSLLAGDLLGHVIETWRALEESQATPEDVIASLFVGNPELTTPSPSLVHGIEFLLYQAIWNRKADENNRARVLDLLNEKIRLLPDDIQDHFVEVKLAHMESLKEKETRTLTWAMELTQRSLSVLQLTKIIQDVQEQRRVLEHLAPKLSLHPSPRQGDLTLEKAIETRTILLIKNALDQIDDLINRPLEMKDLPAIRKALWFAQRNGVPFTDGSYQQLAREGKSLAMAKRRNIRNAKASIYTLPEVDGDYADTTGPKFSNLGASIAVVEKEQGFVPPAIDVTHDAFEKYLDENGIRADYYRIARQMDELFENESLPTIEMNRRIEMKSREMMDLMDRHPIRSEGILGQEIWQAVDSVGLGTTPMMIRSAESKEDSPNAAFAGAAVSFGNVERVDVLNMVQACWKSFWLVRGILYRAHNGIKQQEVNPGVIIQEMIPAEIAGVMFTQNPKDGKDEILITAGYGLGEGPESNNIPFDEYTARKSDGEESGFPLIQLKNKKMVSKTKGSGTKIVSVPRADQFEMDPETGRLTNKPKRALNPSQIKWLVRMGVALEKHYGYPLNIEYGFVADRLAIFQVRAVTTLNQGHPGLSQDPTAEGGATSDILGPFVQPLKRFGKMGWAGAPIIAIYYLLVGFVEEWVFRGALGSAGVSLTSLVSGEGWGMVLGVGVGLFMGIEILSRSAARMRFEGFRAGILWEEMKAEWTLTRSSFSRSRLVAAILFTGVYLGTAHLLPGFELLLAGVVHALWDMRAAWAARKQGMRVQEVLDLIILPQIQSLDVSDRLDRNRSLHIRAQATPESAAQTVAVSFLFGNEARAKSLDRITDLLNRSSPIESETFFKGISFQNPDEMAYALKLFEDIQSKLEEGKPFPRGQGHPPGVDLTKRIGVSLGLLETAALHTPGSEGITGAFYSAVIQEMTRGLPGLAPEEALLGVAEGFQWGARMAGKARVYSRSEGGESLSSQTATWTPEGSQKGVLTLPWTHLPSHGSPTDRAQTAETLANEVLSVSQENRDHQKTLVVITDDTQTEIETLLRKTGRVTDEALKQVKLVLVSEDKVVKQTMGSDGRSGAHYLVSGVLHALAQIKSKSPDLENLEEKIKHEQIRISLYSSSLMDWRLGDVTDPELKAKLPQVIQLLQIMKGIVIEVATESLTGDIEKEWLRRIQA